MFLESVLPTFTHMNQFLQRDEPYPHITSTINKAANASTRKVYEDICFDYNCW